MTQLLKTLFDLCFYYTLSSYYFYIITLTYPMNYGVPLLMASAALFTLTKRFLPAAAARSGGGKKRINPFAVICCAIPGLFFAFSPSLTQMIQFAPAWAYLGFSLLTDRVYTDRRVFEDHFAFSAKVLLLMFFGIVALGRIVGAAAGAAPYLALYLLSGVCLMRILREEGKVSEGRNVFAVLVFLGGSAALALLRTPGMLVNALGFIYRNIIANILMGVVYVVGVIAYAVVFAIKWLIALFSSEKEFVPPNFTGMEDAPLSDEYDFVEMGFPAWLRITCLVIVGLALALVVFLILRKMLGRKRAADEDEPYTEEVESIKRQDRAKRGGLFRPKEPRQAVRWYYRKYLKEGMSRGARLSVTDTSLRVLRRYGGLFAEPDSKALREVYIAARYRRKAPVTEADAEAASELWRRLKKGGQ
ncbi:MAG: hypothetical protein FWG48_02205 [Oscillospiraceae bacterium]|nr:hypothetical protein [Oscillospiraceae bacterium]